MLLTGLSSGTGLGSAAESNQAQAIQHVSLFKNLVRIEAMLEWMAACKPPCECADKLHFKILQGRTFGLSAWDKERLISVQNFKRN